jgi:hypothetical protein
MPKLLSALLCLLILLVAPIAQAQQPPTIPMYVFYADDCSNCQAILQSYVPTLKSQYPFLDIKTFELGDPKNYEALAKLEKKFNKRGQELPVIFIGDQMLSGDQEIMGRLDPLILEYQMRGALAPPCRLNRFRREGLEKTFSVEMAYFIRRDALNVTGQATCLNISQKYPHLNVTQIDLNTADGKRLNETLSVTQSPPEKRLIAPSIFIGNDFLSPEEITESSVEALVEKYERVETKSALKVEQGEMKKADDAIVERFKSFGIFAILLAGLVEGLNPCALATLVFFISYQQ